MSLDLRWYRKPGLKIITHRCPSYRQVTAPNAIMFFALLACEHLVVRGKQKILVHIVLPDHCRALEENPNRRELKKRKKETAEIEWTRASFFRNTKLKFSLNARPIGHKDNKLINTYIQFSLFVKIE